MAGSICPNCRPSTASFGRCPLSPSRTRSVGRCLGPIGRAPSIMACRSIYIPSPSNRGNVDRAAGHDRRCPANWQGTVYHGLPLDLHSFTEQPGEYLAFLGRISPEKRVDRAIEIARRAGLKLKIAAKIDRADRAYYEKEIAHLFKDPLVEYVGEIGGRAKDEFLGNARALLFPIDWPEPFGLVMIEALACGTPVIAWRCGSVPEVIDDGVTGFIVDSLDEAVQAVSRVTSLSRRRCREVFEQRFSAARMTQDYVAIYERLVQEWKLRRKSKRIFVPLLRRTGKNHQVLLPGRFALKYSAKKTELPDN